MVAGKSVEGRRREDTVHGMLPDEIQPGDYWKVLNRKTGEPMKSEMPTNLTGEVWKAACPTSYGYALANLAAHTVREHEDGAISVKPSDGSSNSILVTGHGGERWHGYIYEGRFESVE